MTPKAGYTRTVLQLALSHSSLRVCVLYFALYGYSEEKRLFTTPP
jgi:hypothetical protein